MGGLGQGLAGAWTGAWTKHGGAWTVFGLGLAWGIHHNGVGDAPSYEHSLTVGSAFFLWPTSKQENTLAVRDTDSLAAHAGSVHKPVIICAGGCPAVQQH